MRNLKNLKPAGTDYFLRYGGALGSVLVVLGITLVINLFLTPIVSPLFLAAIFFSAWWGGMLAGFAATLLSGVLIDYFFVPPLYNVSFSGDEIIRFIIFSTEGFLFSWLITSRMLSTEEIRESREHLRSLSLRQQILREEERKRIALEIHDELGQALTATKMEVHLLGKNVRQIMDRANWTEISENFESIQKTIDSTILSVRRIATELRPALIDDLGLIAALEWQSDEFQRRTGISCKFETNVENIDLNSDCAIAVFRIFQESLTNIMRHAEATSVKVILERTKQTIDLKIFDNGKGIQKDELNGRKSLGILGMHERARSINGEMSIVHALPRGTSVQLSFPLFGTNLLN
jgi:signal transduction histidine kinase